MNIANINKSKLANDEDEFKSLVASDADWILRSPEDVMLLRKHEGSPLSKLPQTDFDEFLASLTFSQGGVSGGSYRPLMASLTINEIFDVFASFGMGMEFALRNQEEKCENGRCVWSWGSFCSHITCIPQVKEPF